MLFFDHRPTVALVAIVNRRDGKALTVRRGEYTCFPGGLVPENRSIDQFAMSAMQPIALCGRHPDARHVLVSRFDGEWDGRPASVHLICYPSLSFEPLPGLGAEWTGLDDESARFDVFVEEFKRAR